MPDRRICWSRLNIDTFESAMLISNELFSEAPYYDGYKAIRNQLRAYDPIRLIEMCLQYLHQPYARPIEYLERHPWCVLLLIKWILVDDEYDDRNRPTPTNSQTVKLLQQVIKLAGKVRMPSDYDYVTLHTRTMVFQQVLYQQEPSTLQSGRQMFYFEALEETHYIPHTFREVTKISLNRFLQLSLAFHTIFLRDNSVRHYIGNKWFGELQRADDTGDINLFLGLLSASFSNIRTALRRRDAETIKTGRIMRAASEYAEQSPLMQTPLILLKSGDYMVIDAHLLKNCLNNFVYNTLRNFDVQNFMSHFGSIFENYVRLAVDFSRLDYRDENDLKILLAAKQGRNLIDFLIADDNAHIFVDAKAGEMNYRGTVTHDSIELAKFLDTSLLKAIKQANSVIADLARLNSADPVFKPRSRNYLLVVTYAKTNIGNGSALAECVGLAKIEEVSANQQAGLQIPIENMYFLTIDEFEQLVTQVATGFIGLVEALERAKLSDNNPVTRLMFFEQHLITWDIGGAVPDYLVEKTSMALNRIADFIR